MTIELAILMPTPGNGVESDFADELRAKMSEPRAKGSAFGAREISLDVKMVTLYGAVMFPIETEVKDGRKLIIDQAESKDAEDILVYLDLVGGETDNLSFGKGEANYTLEQERDLIVQYRNSRSRLMLVARVEGELVSTLAIWESPKARLKHVGLLGISVLRQYWGLGVGKEVMAASLDWVKHRSELKKVELTVRADNLKAIRLYQQLGFEFEGY